MPVGHSRRTSRSPGSALAGHFADWLRVRRHRRLRFLRNSVGARMPPALTPRNHTVWARASACSGRTRPCSTSVATSSPRMIQNAACVVSPGKSTFIPKMLVISVSGSIVTLMTREQAQDVVLAVRDHRLVRLLERLDDLLVVVEQVPDPLGGVDDVVEVELELLGEEALDAPLEQAQRGALGLDDLAVGDDLLLHVGDVADDLLRARPRTSRPRSGRACARSCRGSGSSSRRGRRGCGRAGSRSPCRTGRRGAPRRPRSGGRVARRAAARRSAA